MPEKLGRRGSKMDKTIFRSQVNISSTVPVYRLAYESDALTLVIYWKTQPQAGFYFYDHSMLLV